MVSTAGQFQINDRCGILCATLALDLVRHRLPFLPPALLVAVAVVQFVVAHVTPLSAWKGGGFGMFSTSNHTGSRVLRIHLDTEAGLFVVPGPSGAVAARTWPRAALLRSAARRSACARWRLVPLDSFATVVFPDPKWERFYGVQEVRKRSALQGFAVPAEEGVQGDTTVRGARASVVWLRLDVGETSVLDPEVVASVSVSRAEAGCPP